VAEKKWKEFVKIVRLKVSVGNGGYGLIYIQIGDDWLDFTGIEYYDR